MTAQLILIGGPAGSGKTTTAHAWASQNTEPTVHVNLDSVRQWVKSGLQQPHVVGWTPEVDRQYDLARRAVLAAVREYLAGGVTCVVDDGLLPTHPAISYDRWAEHLADLPHRVVVLLPTLQTCLARNAQRPDQGRLTDALVRRFHEMSTRWRGTGVPVIDNTDMDLDGTVRAITAALTT